MSNMQRDHQMEANSRAIYASFDKERLPRIVMHTSYLG